MVADISDKGRPPCCRVSEKKKFSWYASKVLIVPSSSSYCRRARQMRLPTSYKPAVGHRTNPAPPRSRSLLPSTPIPRPSSPDEAAVTATDVSDQEQRPTRAAPPPVVAQPKPREAVSSLLLPSSSHYRPHSRRHPDASPSPARPKFSVRTSTDVTAAAREERGGRQPREREPSPTRSVVSQPPSTVAAVEARVSLWAELKDIRRRSRTPGPGLGALPTTRATASADSP